MHDPLEYMGSEDCDDDEPEFDLGIPQRYDPGYNGDWTQLPRICCECGKTFRLSDNGRAASGKESVLDDYCYECLGMTMEEFLGLE